MVFPVSGVEVHPLIPIGVAFVVSFFTSMGGVSGAFLLLPFQMSVLGYTSPSVSGTNQVFNILAIPSGVYRYIREGRMLWPLTWSVIIGTLPGVVVGAWVRITWLPEPGKFKFFAGLVLLYIGFRLFLDVIKNKSANNAKSNDRNASDRHSVRVIETSIRQVSFQYDGETHSFSPLTVYGICFLVGIVGGIYGGRCDCGAVLCGHRRVAGIHSRRCRLDGHLHHIDCRRGGIPVVRIGLYRCRGRTGLDFGSAVWIGRYIRYVSGGQDAKIRAGQDHQSDTVLLCAFRLYPISDRLLLIRVKNNLPGFDVKAIPRVPGEM